MDRVSCADCCPKIGNERNSRSMHLVFRSRSNCNSTAAEDESALGGILLLLLLLLPPDRTFYNFEASKSVDRQTLFSSETSEIAKGSVGYSASLAQVGRKTDITSHVQLRQSFSWKNSERIPRRAAPDEIFRRHVIQNCNTTACKVGPTTENENRDMTCSKNLEFRFYISEI